MNTIQVMQDVVLFQFAHTSDSLIGINIVAIFNGDEYLLIDTGYEENASQVVEFLTDKVCKYVIQTHYHPDHAFGLRVLEDVIKIGSKNASITLNEFGLEDDTQLFPDIEVDGTYIFEFGKHTFKFNLNIGHSICGMLIDLNDKILFVGDDILRTNDGKAIFPYLTLEDIDTAISAQDKILKYGEYRLVVPGHGKLIEDMNVLKKDVENRISYFNFLKTDWNLEDFEHNTKIYFSGNKSWHEHNVVESTLNDR